LQDSFIQIEGICAAEARPVRVNTASSIFIEPAGFALFIQPPLQCVKAAIFIPLAKVRRPDDLQPSETCGRLNVSNLYGKDDYTIIFARAAFATAQALKTDILNLGGQCIR
jgi:hypothetical protein